jgi:hypothetical protein
VLPRDGEARDVRWFRGPSRNTLHFLNSSDAGNTVDYGRPHGDGELIAAVHPADLQFLA